MSSLNMVQNCGIQCTVKMDSALSIMIKTNIMFTFTLLILIIPMAKGGIPGTFFWKPRLAIDLSVPTTEPPSHIMIPTEENIKAGLVVILDGYQAGMTIIALAGGLSSGTNYLHLNPMSAVYYNTVYRWALRYISLVPFWAGGGGGHFCDTHKVWKRRFYYMDEFVPRWLEYLFPYVSKESWDEERHNFKRFKKISESAFGKHFKYPNKYFNNFASAYTRETVEDMSISRLSGSSSSESTSSVD